MPYYPNLPIDKSSRITSVRSGRSTVTTTDGTVAQTLTHTNEKLNYRLVHSYLTQMQWQELEAFYAANAYSSFTWTLDGTQRLWQFVDKPLYTMPSPLRRTYTVNLREV